MKKFLFFTFFLVLGWIMVPTHGISALIYYDAYGSINDKDNKPLPITGGMYIENQLRKWGTGEPVDYTADIPVPREFHHKIENIGMAEYGLSIEFFNFKVGDNNFYGSGDFYIILERWSDPASDVKLDYSQWFLDGSQGSQWDYWGTIITHEKPIHINEKISLAEHVYIYNLHYWDFDCPILGDPYDAYPNLDLTLVRQDPVPVPEPSTGILFGIGIAGMFIYRLRGSASSLKYLYAKNSVSS